MTKETAHLITVVALLLKTHLDDDTMREYAQRVVSLLEKIVLIPELAELKGEILRLLDEAKCQVGGEICRRICVQVAMRVFVHVC